MSGEPLPAQRIGLIDESMRVTFVRSSRNDNVSDLIGVDKKVQDGNLTGVEARSFYQDLLEDPTCRSTTSTANRSDSCSSDHQRKPAQSSLKSRSQRKHRSEEVSERDINRFLRAAATGDEEAVEEYIEKGVNLDVTDNFGWTALMCAAAANKENVCRLLISLGANYDITDRRGRSVIDLLRENNLHSLKKTLFADIRARENPSSSTRESDEDEETLYCDVCQKELSCSATEHLSSTLHILNARKTGTKHTGYVIPPTNIGYRLMRNTGWDEDQGLGKEGEGKKFPIRTVLKRDRAGLGLTAGESRVTHFEPMDKKAVQSQPKPSKRPWRSEQRKKESRDAKIARDFRSAFNYDDTVAEYLGL